MNFALIGAAGYVAPRHLNAVAELGHRVVAAVDPHDSVGHMDRYFPDAHFFTEIERFDRHLEKLRRGPQAGHVHYVSICSPNYLHDAHVRLALRVNAHAICEKPLVISPWNLDALSQLEEEHGRHVYTVLQLRFLPSLIQLKESMPSPGTGGRADVCLTYVTRRGRWYNASWKGNREKSGGVAMNIGIHLFDLLVWLFGEAEHSEVHLHGHQKMAGVVELRGARVRWFLSTDEGDLPPDCRTGGRFAYRSIMVDGHEMEFSSGFTDLHTRVYQEVLEGRGARISDARPAIELVHHINRSEVIAPNGGGHPALATTTDFPSARGKAA